MDKEALAREKRHKKRQKKVLEQLRADDGTGTLFMSPSKIQAARDIASGRDRQKEQLEQDKMVRAQARALQKVMKEEEAQWKREARAVARAEKQEAAAQKKASLQKSREAERAQRALEKTTKQQPIPHGRPPINSTVKKQKAVKKIKETPQ
ncbi:hypothetical protein LTR62_000895 [Meristemomyces frigidus]|uniref:Uncharacterized protein n=1 Tax=Meristemomyces frigidus TaxID=1508187 RepID=A0AAN7T9W5_9PEZI|nr:hypothetical protein LTR62_000895 [Meristemomyces frigidus]